jgi:hypothetical protein
MTKNVYNIPNEVQLDRLVASAWDFQQALSAITFLLEDIDFDAKYTKVELRRFRCFETTAIVSFARPFVKAKNATVFNSKLVGLKLTYEQRKLKDKLISLRHKIAAHSDEAAMHFRVDVFNVDLKAMEHGSMDSVNWAQFQYIESLYLSEEEVLQLEDLLRMITQRIHEYLYHLCQSNPELIHKYKKPTIEFS